MIEVAAEIRGVVRVDRDKQAEREHFFQRVVGEGVDHAQFEVGQRAQGQRHRLGRQPPDQRCIGERGVAVVDALDLERIQRAANILRRTFFAGVGDAAVALFARARKHPGKFLRRIAALAGVETDTDDLVAVAVGFRRRQGIECVLLIEMAQKAHDEFGTHIPLARGVAQRRADAIDHRRQRRPAGGMRLRVEEEFQMADVLRRGFLRERMRQVIEIALTAQHFHPLIIDVEEALQVVEAVGGAQRVHR